MAVEAKRGCGYRKVGGLYMVSGKLSAPCGRLPIELHVCPVCDSGIKQTRGFQWIKPAPLLSAAKACDLAGAAVARAEGRPACYYCPAGNLELLGERAGLLWVGGSFYPTVESFMAEAAELGVSRRISALPRGFDVGKHWVLIGHPAAIKRWPRSDDEQVEVDDFNRVALADGHPELTRSHLIRKGIVTFFKPVAIEKIVTQTESEDVEAMADLVNRGISPVVVPDDDVDHRGSVFDKAKGDTKPGSLFDDEAQS